MDYTPRIRKIDASRNSPLLLPLQALQAFLDSEIYNRVNYLRRLSRALVFDPCKNYFSFCFLSCNFSFWCPGWLLKLANGKNWTISANGRRGQALFVHEHANKGRIATVQILETHCGIPGQEIRSYLNIFFVRRFPADLSLRRP